MNLPAPPTCNCGRDILTILVDLEKRVVADLLPAREYVRNNAPENAAMVVLEVALLQQRGPQPSLRPQEIRHQRWQQKQELFGMIKGLRAQGMRAFEIVKATRISRGTVDKWLRLSECPLLRSKKAPRPRMAEYLRDELQRLWDQECQNVSKLLVEIRKLPSTETHTSCR
jgi:hypothetical protein